jgi:hypothetical protein
MVMWIVNGYSSDFGLHRVVLFGVGITAHADDDDMMSVQYKPNIIKIEFDGFNWLLQDCSRIKANDTLMFYLQFVC